MFLGPPKMWGSISTLVLLVALGSCQDFITTVPPGEDGKATPPLEKAPVKPTIRSLHITSNVKYRYATTLVSTRVVNPSNYSGEATFTVTLPESAFISEFLMEIKDKVYKAYVKEKAEAKAIYQQAVDAGQFAGHVALDARDSNQFTVSVNIEAHGKVTFNLTYEQLLARNLGVYTNVININPNQIVEDMLVSVNIEEPTAIVNLEVPELQISNEAIPEKQNEYAKIEEKSPNHTQVIWAPTPDEQRNQNSTGLNGQFIVKYDVDRKENPQQILVDEGYFVHFFAPENLPKLRKHVIFVLDFSGSMGGRKLDQLKEAMKQIFSDLDPKDYFSVVIFQSWVEVWSPSGMYTTSRPSYYRWYSGESQTEKPEQNKTLDSTYVVEATPENIELARSFMANYTDLGSTNIMGGLRTGLQLVDIGEEQWANESDPPQPVIVFLTDGQPNVEEYDTNVIINNTKSLNTKQSPIFSLAFGYGADYKFLRKLSLQNSGFARNIYEAADATQQLKNFYKTVASPLLSNVTFTYLPGQVDNSSSTRQEFPVFFRGSELVVAGRFTAEDAAQEKSIGELHGISASGPVSYPMGLLWCCPQPLGLKPQNRTAGHLEKAWSYLTIQQLLDKVDSLDDGEEKNQTRKKALDLALQYAFVTPLTSLVVVKPNETESSVDATKVKPGLDNSPGLAFLSSNGFVGGAGGYAGGSAIMAAPASGYVPLSLSTSQGAAGGFVAQSRPRPQLTLEMISTTASVAHHYPGPPQSPLPVSDSVLPARWPIMVTSGMDSTDDDSRISIINEDKIGTGIPSAHKVLLEDIKWLQPVLNNTDTNKSLTLDGNNYKLGLNETNTDFGACQVNNDSGECRHLQYCTLDIFQDDISQFLPYKCHIPGDYLGVCCPKNLV